MLNVDKKPYEFCNAKLGEHGFAVRLSLLSYAIPKELLPSLHCKLAYKVDGNPLASFESEASKLGKQGKAQRLEVEG